MSDKGVTMISYWDVLGIIILDTNWDILYIIIFDILGIIVYIISLIT